MEKSNPYSAVPNSLFIMDTKQEIRFVFDEESINPQYLEEVVNHIKNDFPEIQKVFSVNGLVNSIHIGKAGNETHYGGKSPLFLTLKLNDAKELKLVYKPRSLDPEIILEQALSSIDGRPPRQMLSRENRGYDLRIEGDHIKTNNGKIAEGEYFITEIVKLCIQDKANQNLVLALKFMGFEDIHGENFILDANGRLHFIDAEVFQTNMSVNVDDICCYRGTPNIPDDPPFPSNPEIENQIKNLTQKYQEQLKQIPTRLVICSTQTYALPTPFFMKDTLVIGKCHLKGLKKVAFKEYHTAFFAKFLFENRYINVEESDSLETIKEKINGIFTTLDPIGKINAELDAVKAQKANNPRELPAFRFHLSQKWIECP
ncbi:MAG: DUF4135 domain-containing protein, partial [Simkania sp.]|nr:DUF4135 domain-containing protein [Simkania sp.]